MKFSSIHIAHSLCWIIALGVLWMSTAGCTVQKRTTTRGFHIEHRAARLHALVAAETNGLPGFNQMSALNQADELKRLKTRGIQPAMMCEVPCRSILPVNGVLASDTGALKSKAPRSRREKLKNSVLALSRSNNLDTASQVIEVPLAQLEELREEARKASKWNFLLGLLHLPWSIIQGEEYLIYQGVGFLVLGWYIKRLAQDDARLLAWKERRQLERQRCQNRTWWQWLLLGVSVASLFLLLYLFVAFTYGFGVWAL